VCPGVNKVLGIIIPLILLGGLLLGLGVNNISGLFKSKFYKLGVVLGVAVYLLIIIKPVWLGQLNGVLSGKQASGDFNNIYQKLSKDPRNALVEAMAQAKADIHPVGVSKVSMLEIA